MNRKDLILIGSILIFSLVFIFCFQRFPKTSGDTLEVRINGNLHTSYPLDKEQTISIPLDNHYINTFEIKNGKVTMLEANCPDHLCVKQRSIQYNNETIVCLPHQVVLLIKSNSPSTLDAVTQ